MQTLQNIFWIYQDACVRILYMAIDQSVFNLIVTACGGLGGWVMKLLYDQIKDLQGDCRRTCDKLSSVEVLIAGQYISVAQFNTFSADINRKLDSISDKLDRKADKP